MKKTHSGLLLCQINCFIQEEKRVISQRREKFFNSAAAWILIHCITVWKLYPLKHEMDGRGKLSQDGFIHGNLQQAHNHLVAPQQKEAIIELKI